MNRDRTFAITTPAALLVSLTLLAGGLAGCANTDGPANDGGTRSQVLLDHSGGTTDTPFRNDRQNAYN